MQQNAVSLEIFVDGFADTLEVAVIIDGQHSADRDSRVEMLKLVARGLIQVGVEARKGLSSRARAQGECPQQDQLRGGSASGGYPVDVSRAKTSSREGLKWVNLGIICS